MAILDLGSKTRDLIFSVHEKRAYETPRTHLGASLIGRACERELWQSFRWASNEKFDGRMLRLFETGHREEERIIAELRAAGVEVLNEEAGHQFRFLALGGHFAGSVDGVLLGIPEAPKTWHLLECKTMNANNFKKLMNQGVQKSKPEHYAQMQTYMAEMELTRAIYIAVNKDTDDIYTERVEHDSAFAAEIKAKAERVIFSPLPPERISKDFENGACRFCQFKNRCHALTEDLPAMNCRTCINSTPKDDGTWFCEAKKESLTKEMQLAGCERHVFIPALIPMELVEIQDEPSITITYKSSKSGQLFFNHEETVGEKFTDVPF